MVDIPEIEAKLPKSFSQLYSVIAKILKDNKIMPDQEESKVDQL
jgi:rRNA pseudouridine-1189 N-methylase Emg1 (Nep1/Mra1 family)